MTDHDILINVTQLAQRLGVSRWTIYNRLAKCQARDWQGTDDSLLPLHCSERRASPTAGGWPTWTPGWNERPMKRVV